jgi:gluconate 2-dehydrogenase gamma chain
MSSSRRDFLADAGRAAAAAFLASQLPMLAGCATSGEPSVRLTPAEVRTMRAFAARILPSHEGVPGADEAGAVHFVERALGTPPFAAALPVIREGLADLDARARATGRSSGFSGLGAERQTEIMRQVEYKEFFAVARQLVLIGTFADPSYGGNQGMAGWTMIGIDHRPTYTAPFGYYDAPAPANPSAAAR